MDQPVQRDRTKELAEFVVGLTLSDLSDADTTHLKGLVLDHLGVAFRGATLPWGEALSDWAAPHDGSGKCQVLGTNLSVTPAIAGMVNASCAHGLELDDTHDESVTHPGAVVIASALAVGTELGLGAKDFLPAIVAGYEVMTRVGMATGAKDILEKGFHPTALFGGFGAVAVAARLYGFSADTLCEAWGLMLSMAGGSMQFSQDAFGTTVKRMHGGYGAHNGITAAEFARRGIAGPNQAFDGIYGLCNLFGSTPDFDRLVPDGKSAFEIHRISYKPYPCCRLFHSTIDALRDVTNGFTAANDDITRIQVGGPASLQTQHMLARPTSMMAAQYSLPYTLGAALVAGPFDEAAFEPDRLNDTEILKLADMVGAETDQALEDAFPEHFGSWVEITYRSGDKRRADVLDSYGTPANPMPFEALLEKFDGLVRAVKPDFDVSGVTTMLDSLTGLDHIFDLMTPFKN
jgi:2-methylcitrate dehydratase PrpD